ncbi:MAG: transcriptional repressor [Candidatus Komeilibacteria bacterium]|nr:transcriptional repressor [Candidatus Komeilibacteria bacterium]
MLKTLKEKLLELGLRQTRLRALLADFLDSASEPLSVPELNRLLLKHKNQANKTSIYRELAFLIKHDLVREVEFGEGKKRYESALLPHHHHLICQKCQQVTDVTLGSGAEMIAWEKLISAKAGFKVTNHLLEFFGFCQKCR